MTDWYNLTVSHSLCNTYGPSTTNSVTGSPPGCHTYRHYHLSTKQTRCTRFPKVHYTLHVLTLYFPQQATHTHTLPQPPARHPLAPLT